MTEGVVDVLEVVEVDEERGHGPVFAPGAHEHLFGPVEDEGPVGQAGQGVVEGLVGELVLRLLALGDVAQVGHVPADRRAVL